MASNISQIRNIFLNGNLTSNNPDIHLNKRVYIIGTADKGPVGTPVPIVDVANIETYFGSYGTSPLSLKLRETWMATADSEGTRQIFGVRLGGGQYASIEIPETSITNPNYQRTTASYALKITAKYPGALLLTIKADIVNGQSAVVVYNPETDVESVFTYDFVNLDNTTVDVHTVSELVDAINSDANLSGYIVAEYPTLRAIYEMYITDSGTYSEGYALENGYVTVELTDRTVPVTGAATTIYGTDDLYTGYTKAAPVAAENLLIDVDRVYELSVIKEQLIDGAGYREFNLTKDPIQYPGQTTKLIDLAGVMPSGTIPQYRQIFRQALMGVVADTSTTTYTMLMYASPDIYGGDTNWLLAQADSSYYGADTGWSWSDVAETYSASDTSEDHLIVYFKHGTSVTPIPRSNITATWEHDATNGPTLSITIDGTYMSTYIQAGDAILIDVDSVKAKLYEVTTYQSLASRPYFFYYFVAGKRITFGASLQSAIEITYPYVKEYTVGENVILSDSKTGKFTFTDNTYTLGSIGDCEVISRLGGTGLGIQDEHPLVTLGTYTTTIPQAAYMHAGTADPNYRLIHRDNNNGTRFTLDLTDAYNRLGLNYTYEPEWPYLTSVAYTLQGGTSGINIDANQKYEELETVFASLEPYQPDIVVLAGLYFDDVKRSSNPITGVPEDVNAGYHLLLNSFISTQSTESRPVSGLCSVKNPIGYSTEVVGDWITKLTTVDSKDITRAANVKLDFLTLEPEFIGVLAMPLIKQLNGRSYVTTAEATVAGMLSALPANEALNHKQIRGIIGVPYSLTRSQSDLLSGANYITYMYSEPYGYVVANDPTVRGIASDYNTLSVVWSIHDLVTSVRSALMPFLGKKYSEAIRNSAQAAVDKVIREKIIAGSIINAVGTVITSEYYERLGKLEVPLTVRPAFGIREITIPVKASMTI